MDYPYPTSFLAPLPANPVIEACKPLSTPFDDDQDLLIHIFEAASVYFNFTGKAECLNIAEEDSIGEIILTTFWIFLFCNNPWFKHLKEEHFCD